MILRRIRNEKKLAFIGAGGHSDSVLSMIDKSKYEFVGYFDDKPIKKMNGYPILGTLSDAKHALLKKTVDNVFVTIGDNGKRKEVFDDIAEKNYESLINIISKTATITTEEALQGRGIFIGHNSFLGAKSFVDDNSIINTGSIVEHHSTIAKHCNVCPNATINGGTVIGEGSYLGSGCTILQTLHIAPWTVIGAGGVVLKNIDLKGVFVGVPAKQIK